MKTKFPYKQFIKMVAAIAVPVAAQNLLSTTGSMVDTMMISKLGELSVGAVGLCAQFSSLMFSCYWGFVGGGMLFFAQYWGARDDKGINVSYGITLSCMMIVGLTFCGFACFKPEFIMNLYTDKPNIQAIGVEYLRIVGWSYPLQVLAMAMAALLRCTERVVIPLIGAIASVLTNTLLNYILIFGKFGAPELGVRGAAIATIIASVVNVLVIVIGAVSSGHRYILAIKEHFRIHWDMVVLYFKKIYPILLNELLIGIGNMLINYVLGRQSEQAIAATAVFRTLEGFIIGFFAGFSNAGSVLVGKEVGAGNLKLAYDRALRLIYMCIAFIGIGDLFLISIHSPLFKAMSLSGESFRICTGMLLIFSVADLFRMGNWAMNDTYRSAGDATFGTILEISFLFALVVPSVFISGFVFKAPFLVVFACCYIDEPIRSFLMQMHLFRGKWIKPVTTQGKEALAEFRKNLLKKESCN